MMPRQMKPATVTTLLSAIATLCALSLPAKADFPNPVFAEVAGAIPLSRQCANKDFEAQFADWTTFRGSTPSGHVPAFTPVPPTLFSGCTEGGNGTHCVTTSTGTDPAVGIPASVSGLAARLGGLNLPILSTPGSNGRSGEGMAKRFVVQASDAVYKFRYASVLERAHDGNAQNPVTGDEPYFAAYAVDAVTGDVIDSFTQAASGWNPNVLPFAADPAIRYIPWTCAKLDLSSHVGREVVVYFVNGDCAHGGHTAYSYVDDTCSDCEVVEPPKPDVTIDPAPKSCSAAGEQVVTGKLDMPVEVGATNVNVVIEVRQGGTTVMTLPATITGDTYTLALDPALLTTEGCFDLVPVVTYSIVTPTGNTISQRFEGDAEGRNPGADNDLCTNPAECTVQCTPFEPEVQCNEATGTPIIRLRSVLTGSFDPTQIKITSMTNGVAVSTPNPNDPLTLLLGGATAGQSVLLNTEAVEAGAGEGRGLDLCCMGQVEVKIPEGFTCEAKQVLDVTKTCELGDYPSGATADCQITVHYEGPAPDAANPITLSDAVTTAGGWSIEGAQPLLTDNWQCPPVPHAGPAPWACTISAADEPNADWSNWTSSIVVQMSTQEAFENCAKASTTSGLEATGCWSTTQPKLQIAKTGPAQCHIGEPCTYSYTVTNTDGTTPYNGPITLSDVMSLVDVTGAPVNASGTFTGMVPAICSTNDLNSGSCTGPVSIPAGGSQSFTVNYLPPAYAMPVDLGKGENCVTLTTTAGEENTSCHTVEFLPPRVSIDKTGPSECAVGASCDFTVTLTAGNQPFSGDILLLDGTTVPGFNVTGITPAPSGCGGNLPANPMACVMPLTLAANATQSWTITMTPDAPGGQVVTNSGENCATLAILPGGGATADHSFDQYANPNGMPQALADILMANGVASQSCVPVKITDAPIDLAIDKGYLEGEAFFNAANGAQVPPHGFVIDVSQTLGQLQAGDLVIVTDPQISQVGVTPFGLPLASSPWVCTMNGGSATCQFTVPSTGAIAPPPILWPAVLVTGIDSSNCASVSVFRNGQPMVETDTGNNTSCITIPEDGETQEPEFDVTKTCVPLQRMGAAQPYACSITVTTNGVPFQGTLTVEDAMQMTGVVGDPNALVTGIGSSDPWNCNTGPFSATNLPSCGMDGTYFPHALGASTINVVLMVHPGLLEQAEVDNCATLALDGSDVAGPSCFPFNSEETPTETPEFNIFKECDPIVAPDAAAGSVYPLSMSCRIKVQPLVPFTGQITIDDVVSNLAGGGQFAFLSGLNFDPAVWSCPTATSAALSCLAEGATYPVDAQGNPTETIISVTTGFTQAGGPVTWQNCATGNYVLAPGESSPLSDSCDQQIYTPPAPPSEAQVTLTKTCLPIVDGPTGRTMTCRINVSTTAPVTGVTINDLAQQMAGTQGGTISQISTQTVGWSCSTPGGGATTSPTADCFTSVGTTLDPGSPVTILVTMDIAAEQGTVTWQNCASGSYSPVAVGGAAPTVLNQIPPACDTKSFSVTKIDTPPPASPVLDLVKTAPSACTVNRAAQTYECDFDLMLSNLGTGTFTGPLTLTDSFGDPAPKGIAATAPAGWDCHDDGGKGATCLNGNVTLEAGGSTTIGMALTIPGVRSGGSFENCATLGVGASSFEQATIVQTAMRLMGIDGGPVDGKPGRKTREGVRELQTRLGLDPTGEITPDLLRKLGLQLAEDNAPSCVRVDLPPMPEPPLVCDSTSTVARGEACSCAYSGMVQRSKTSCSCTKGTVLVPGKGCVKPTLTCDRATTLSRGDSCACRYDNMYQRNKTSCGCVKGTKFVAGKGCIKPEPPRCDSATTVARGDSCVCRYQSMSKRNATSCSCGKGSKFVAGKGCVRAEQKQVCKNGLPPVPGIGCVNISIGIGGPRKGTPGVD